MRQIEAAKSSRKVVKRSFSTTGISASRIPYAALPGQQKTGHFSQPESISLSTYPIYVISMDMLNDYKLLTITIDRLIDHIRAHSRIDDHAISSRITCAESPLMRSDRSWISSGTRSSSMFRQA